MEEFNISNFNEFYDVIENFKASIIYRGHTSLDYQLIPKVGRLEYLASSRKKFEKQLFDNFKKKYLPFHERYLEKDINILALGQHHGLPTRLLDWTKNPLVAAYFAVEKDYDEDSVVFAFEIKENKDINIEEIKPFEITRVQKFIPSHFSRRIIVQDGIFTLHPNPKKPLDNYPSHNRKLIKIIIEKKFRKKFKKTLFKFGIHQASLFPDLDGLSEHIRWMYEKSH